MFYIDWTYIILVLPAVIFSLWASSNVNGVYEKYSRLPSRRGLTGYEAARRVLEQNGIYNIRIECIDGKLSDHYDPKAGVIRLSRAVYYGANCAAVGVAAHEAGHAAQHAQSYQPLVLRNAIVPITNIGSRLSVPLILLGILLSSVSQVFATIAYLGVACYSLCALFQLITLPTEFNASRRAVEVLESTGMLENEELAGCKKVLRAAALTYVAALAVSLMQLLRLVMIVGRRMGNRR